MHSRPTCEVHMRDWLVPPVLFPLFLVVLVIAYAIFRAPG